MASAPDIIPRSLPRGRHAAAREVVLASQRGRLLEAMAACVAARGYAATTVADVIARAGVSRKTFYEHFADKRACFLAAWDAGTDLVLTQVAQAAADAPPDWRAKLRAGTEAFVEVIAAEPEFARSFLIEVLGAGDEALARRAEINRRFAAVLAEIYAAARAGEPELGPLPEWVLDAATGAAWELLAEHVRVHGVAGLARLAPRIEQLHLALLRGRYAAA